MIYFIILVVLTLLLGSIVPFVQYLIYRSKKSTPASAFLFPKILFDYKMANLKYERVSTEGRALINRVALSDRGWVRGPNGVVMTAKDFEAKKKSEYDIALP